MLRSVAASVVLLACLAASPPASAQTATIEALGEGEGRAVSADGSVIVGGLGGFFAYAPNRAFRWTSAGGIEHLGNVDDDSRAQGVSADGSVVVGWAELPGYHGGAFRWTADKGMQDLGTIEDWGDSSAIGVSADGSVIVGYSTMQSGNIHAFRWTAEEGMQDLGTLGGIYNTSYATGISADGSVIVGSSMSSSSGDEHAFRWTADEGMQDLGAVGGAFDDSAASGISADGSVVVGYSMSPSIYSAFRWTAADGMQDIGGSVGIEDYSGAHGVSSDGSVIVGYYGSGGCVWHDGEKRSLWDLLKNDYGLDPSNSGWSSLDEVKACSADGKSLTGYGEYQEVRTAFRVTLSEYPPSNRAPTVAPIAFVTLECVAGHHRVTLATTVNDPDGQSLSVTWKVNGEARKTQTGVGPGAGVAFEWDYGHGAHAVAVEVSDGVATTTAGTTVSVQDTASPIVVVAGDVVVPTDPGQAFATNVTLPPPTASDASGHPVTSSSDARSSYPLGVTLVTWTAADESGNKATAPQNVIVVDQEKPAIASLPAIRTFCDAGKTFATIKLSQPTAKDNAPGLVSMTTTAGPTFKIGVTNVVWTATDTAGNQSQTTQKVTVVNRKPKADAGKNVTITTKSEKGAKVILDGSTSSDLDKHKLRYAWKAKGVKFAKSATPEPSGVFKVGTTTVTLTVTDAGGLKHTNTIKVTVKLKNGKRRPRGSDANRSFAAASQQAGKALAGKGSSGAALSGLAYANAASAYGDTAGEFVRREEGQSEADATLSYAELRALQQTYGRAAALPLRSAYLESGDESLLSAYAYAAYGTAYAAADLTER